MNDNRKVFIAGTGKSGIAAAKMVLQMGGEVLLYNSSQDTNVQEVMAQFERTDHIQIICGELRPVNLRGVHLAIVSPGIPLTADFITVLDRARVPVIGELELAYQASKGKLAAITGTNGKTTTTALVGEILKKHYNDVHVAGNIGEPFSAEALRTTEESATVVEVSSFMLETINEFKPHVSAILNITPDHLDRHKTMTNYIRCKKAIAINQTRDDYIVLNYSDPELRRFGKSKDLKPKVVWFSSQKKPEGNGLYLSDDCIFLRENGKEQVVIDVHELQLLGTHNYENVMAAVAVGLKMDVPLDKIREALKEFKAVEHRIEFVRERCKVRYYNDSKGTNPDAAIQALKAMPGPTILIAGGYDKHSEYDDWVKLFPGKVKKLVLLGETRDKIYECCKKYGFDEISYAEDMSEAVKACASFADEGDYVLLSPACASWGMFQNYEERGRIFKKCVEEL
ncbi:MAG: UDP-N-acetylmuramoyl-L-alanine--D-glutamate ligase [Lachnospiraceae bacterium]|jgi:UDP-N-acetylmuramoylalanine--D-glutamate ligase|nr:UDP-N-acetylmuramoyl-L-alanine--D-glutamate ligase [Lachnospiraceae bacterium]